MFGLSPRRRRPTTRLRLEPLEDRLAPAIALSGLTIKPVEGASISTSVGTFTDSNSQATLASFSATINYGDGTPTVTVTSTASANGQIVADSVTQGQFDVEGTHTFAEEGNFNVQVIVTDSQNSTSAATASYRQANLVTDDQMALTGLGFDPAAHTDTHLKNPWGIAYGPTGPFWVADNGAGVSTLYDGTGTPLSLVVTIPASGNTGATSPAPVTGIVFNSSTTDFNVNGANTPAHFILVTEDGTVAGWNSGTSAVLKVDNSDFTHGPVYKGLAIGNNGSGNFLYATNFRAGTIDVFDTNFNKITLGGNSGFGTFTDPNANPDLVGYAPFGIQNINNQLYVTYAMQDSAMHDDVAGAGHGFVDVFDLSGHFVKRLASQGTLNSPWGLALAPSTFGTFANDLLVGNFGDGRINVFNPSTNAFLGQLSDAHNSPIAIDGLWGLKFGNNGSAGSAGTLFFTAGISGEQHGLFGSLTAVDSATAQVSDANLVPGVQLQDFTGTGGTNTATNTGSANAALTAFETAVGGGNNGGTASPQTGGFRTITWDGVKLDGTDPFPDTIIDPGHVVGIPINRFQERGVQFEQVYAVSGPASASDASTFTTVNPTVTNLFKAFSPTETFAMFNDNTIDLSFVAASAHSTTPVPAATRGFGAIFLNVTVPNQTSIEYFDGDTSLGKFFVPASSTRGQATFLGELFSSPIVTRVTLTLGTDVLFSFNGTTFSPGPQADDPANNHNLVVTDDFVYAEPVATVATASLGRTFSGAVANFRDLDPNGTASDYTATIQWGDGHQSSGTVASDGNGGFTVSGSNRFTTSGNLQVTVQVQDLGGSSLSLSNTINVLDADHSFVQALYNDFLGRSGSQAELDGWVSALRGPGGSQAAVATAIARSAEAHDHVVKGWYVTFLGRQATGGEEQPFVNLLGGGASEEQALSILLGSSEFFTRAQTLISTGTPDQRYVQALFQLLLHRTGGTDEVAVFVNELPAIGRAGVALQILQSQEYRTAVVTGLYTSFLDRATPPSAAEVAGWVNSGLDLLTIQVMMASSSEYYQNG
jgi:uncharacterized protein (TIGR03118 family)